jgi:predicted transcriptional regulator
MELHVPPELEAKLSRLAETTGRTVEQLALDLLATSVEHDEWFRGEVEKGRASARAGRLLDRDELVARIEKRYRMFVLISKVSLPMLSGSTRSNRITL